MGNLSPLSTEQPGLTFDSETPRWVFDFFPIGDSVRNLLKRYIESGMLGDRFGRMQESELEALALSFSDGKWSDGPAATLIGHLIETSKHTEIDLQAVTRWILLHHDDPDAVSICMAADPPSQIDIVRLLPRTGSQKLVFEARWRPAQRRVALKRLTGPLLDAERVLERESHSSPLSIRHPNIIETYSVTNKKNETFLVEEWLDSLSDDWNPSGNQEAANLLYSLARAVEYVHQLGLVHGDIKPDNIGKKEGRFVLLDFGICRSAEKFAADITATGSLRTRAPELLMNDEYGRNPKATDIWAIGATLFNSLEGRFPFITREEPVPRISHLPEREEFERKLKERVSNEWSEWVRFDSTVDPFKSLISSCLERSPDMRPDASTLRQTIERDLPAYIEEGTVERGTSLAPVAELEQLSKLLSLNDDVYLIAKDDLGRLKARVLLLKERLASGQDPRVTDKLQSLGALLDA